ncbi:cyclodeaminase/cyclohydrolase family protein [Lachnospiraceae bacterium NSJ-143]|nr:cyclodeaminase/cyclohydrolase family protein [Lachnospiraceae bacterium NSJ-143]
MKLSTNTCEEFVQKLASKESVPGGGGAAALSGALGAALASMVANFSKGKKKFLGLEEKHQEIIDKSVALSEKLVALIDEDAENFEPLSRAYGLPKDTPEQAAEKEKVLQECLKVAASGPVKMVEYIYEAIKIQEELVDISTKIIISDVGCGVQFLKAALYSANLNVTVNLNLISDEAYVKEVSDRMAKLVSEGSIICDRVYEKVVDVLG